MVVSNEGCGIDFDKESVLHGRKNDYSEGTDASFGGMFPTEGIGLFKIVE